MATIGDSANIRAAGQTSTIEERARRLYDEIVSEIQSKGIKQRITALGVGYLWNGNVAQVAARCWPDLTLAPGRSGPVSKQFLEVIKTHLRETRNMVFIQERGQFYIAPEYVEKVSRTARKATAQPQKDLATESVTDRAKRIWERARQYCETNSRPTETYNNVEFWACDKPLAWFVKAEFPELCLPAMMTQPAFEKYRRPFYDLLRATTNAVNIGSKYVESMKEGEHYWLIRKEWHDSHEQFENIFPIVEDEEPGVPLDVVDVVDVVEEPKDAEVVVNEAIAAPTTPQAALVVLATLVTEHEVLRAQVADLRTEADEQREYARNLQATLEQAREETETVKANLTIEVQHVEALTAELAVAKQDDSASLIGLIEHVLNDLYTGKVGMSRAIADVEDIVKLQKGEEIK